MCYVIVSMLYTDYRLFFRVPRKKNNGHITYIYFKDARNVLRDDCVDYLR